jgi:hypothetical protein
VDKTYDGTTAATLSTGNYSLSGIVGSDVAMLNDPTSGIYNNANAGTGKTVSVSGLTLSGANAGNYTLASGSISGTVGEIDAKTLTVTLTGMVDKTYDGTATATLAASNYKLSGAIGNDTVTLNDPTSGAYESPTIGTGKTVAVNGLSLLGAGAGNYSLLSSTVSGAVGEIDAATVAAPVVTHDGPALPSTVSLAPVSYYFSQLSLTNGTAMLQPTAYTLVSGKPQINNTSQSDIIYVNEEFLESYKTNWFEVSPWADGVEP